MPSSLVFTALVVAWLAVLVPVVARRRQLVPRPAEADLSSRVLPRPACAPAMEEVVVSQSMSYGRVRPHGATAVADRDHDEEPVEEFDDRDLDHRDLEDRDLDDEQFEDEHDDRDDLVDDLTELDDVDDAPRERRPYRPGRGGFDAEAAAEAAATRYAFRQRVALGLIAVAVVSALAALVVSSALWWLHLAADVALVGYLVFLRRQTRIEEEVRERRLARLNGERRALEERRERQAEHQARLEALEEEWDESLDEDLDAVGDDEVEDEEVPASEREPRWVAPRTPAPVIPVGMELVTDSEDDPDFHDLEGDRVPAYRRAM